MVKSADTPDLGSGTARCKGSSPFSRTLPDHVPENFLRNAVDKKTEMLYKKEQCESSSAVELHLAKVDVAGSSPVFRSNLSDFVKGIDRLFF